MRKRTESNTELRIKKGLRLKECREDKNLTQEELAKLCNYSRKQYIYSFEHGVRDITPNHAHDFAKILNVNEKYLLHETDMKESIDPLTIGDPDTTTIENEIIKCFLMLGCSINAFITPLINDNSEKEIVNIQELKGLDFDKVLCRYEKNGEIREVYITDIQIDNKIFPYKAFRMLVYYVKDMIELSLNNFNHFYLMNAMLDINDSTRETIINNANNKEPLPKLIPCSLNSLEKLSDNITKDKKNN